MSTALRNVYSVAEFAAEILCGKRWPSLQSEAVRFINPPSK